jgi:drug/metabolite transporter (DMT)-like permease
MNLDATWLILSLIPSAIGFVLFVYGKKQSRWPQLAGGLLLMIYPYFTQSVAALLGVGVALAAAICYALQVGW